MKSAREEVLEKLARQLLKALEGEHLALDVMLAERARVGVELARLDSTVDVTRFFPTKSKAWPAVLEGATAMAAAAVVLA